MPEPSCYLCRLLADLHTRLPITDFLHRLKTASQLRCFCEHSNHTPLMAHPHTRPGCIGYTPPAIEIVGTVDRWEEDAHAG